MIDVDCTPLARGPHSVAQALATLLETWQATEGAMELRKHAPGRMTLRRFRARFAESATGVGVLSPWSAFPRVAAPVVVVVHELPFVRGVSEGRLRDLRHRRWLERNVRECAAIVTPTEATRADVLALHPQASARVHVVPHGFEPAPWRAARREPDPSPYAVMVGIGADRHAARKKGLDVAMEAWRRKLVPDGLRLVLVGEPALPLVGGVEARPDLDDEALRHLVAGARVLIYPSRSEGFGYPPLEALAAGVPVVASDVPAVAEVAGAGAVRVPAGDARALADGVARVLADAALRATCLRAGAERIAALTPQRAVAGMRGVFRRLGVPA